MKVLIKNLKPTYHQTPTCEQQVSMADLVSSCAGGGLPGDLESAVHFHRLDLYFLKGDLSAWSRRSFGRLRRPIGWVERNFNRSAFCTVDIGDLVGSSPRLATAKDLPSPATRKLSIQADCAF